VNLAVHPSSPPAGRRLNEKVVAVSGGGSRGGGGTGIGEAIALLFGMHGARVVVGDIDGHAARATVSALKEAGAEAAAVTVDATDAPACARFVATAVERFGALDVLVNNVGVTGPSDSVVDLREDEWDKVMAVNVKSMMLMCKHAVPALTDGGAIINMSSVGALRWTERTAYAASKGAVLSLTTALAGQCAARGIRVNAVVPGAVWTPLVEHETRERAGGSGEAASRIRAQRQRQALLPFEGLAWDVAWAALYLACDESRWVTGQALVVDGGATIARRIDNANADTETLGV
jgi:NAD(P)-dependent dehydrogenase (short-subunit alcohol dehydrogenase family)